MRIIRITLLSLLLLMIALPLYAQGRLTYYCSTDIPWCELMKKEFEKKFKQVNPVTISPLALALAACGGGGGGGAE